MYSLKIIFSISIFNLWSYIHYFLNLLIFMIYNTVHLYNFFICLGSIPYLLIRTLISFIHQVFYIMSLFDYCSGDLSWWVLSGCGCWGRAQHGCGKSEERALDIISPCPHRYLAHIISHLTLWHAGRRQVSIQLYVLLLFLNLSPQFSHIFNITRTLRSLTLFPCHGLPLLLLFPSLLMIFPNPHTY